MKRTWGSVRPLFPRAPAAVVARSVSPRPAERRLERVAVEQLDAAWRTLRSVGVAPADLEDVLQEVFMVVATRLSDVERAKERPFVVGVAIRQAANYRRSRQQRMVQISEPLDTTREVLQGEHVALMSPEDFAARADGVRLLDAALEEMTEGQREVFVLFELEQWSAREIALQLEMAEARVVSLLRRARECFSRFCGRMQRQQTALDSGDRNLSGKVGWS